MTEDTKERAIRLMQEEDRRLAEEVERRRQEAQEERVQDYISRIRAQDRRAEAGRERRVAAAEPKEPAREGHGPGRRTGDATEVLAWLLDRLSAIDREHRDKLRKVGGHDSPTGTPAPHYSDRDRQLPERDPLADSGR